MTTPEKRLQDLQARAINERIVEYGLRHGLLDALRLAYERMRDGSLVVHFPRHRGLWRIQPPDGGDPSEIRLIAFGDDGRVELGRLSIPLSWDPDATDWTLIEAGETDEVAAEVWKRMAFLAREAGWLERTAA